jgi:hypothetical protein
MYQELSIQTLPLSTISGRILLTVGISLSEIQVNKTNFQGCSSIDPKLSVSFIVCPRLSTVNCGFQGVGTTLVLSSSTILDFYIIF